MGFFTRTVRRVKSFFAPKQTTTTVTSIAPVQRSVSVTDFTSGTSVVTKRESGQPVVREVRTTSGTSSPTPGPTPQQAIQTVIRREKAAGTAAPLPAPERKVISRTSVRARPRRTPKEIAAIGVAAVTTNPFTLRTSRKGKAAFAAMGIEPPTPRTPAEIKRRTGISVKKTGGDLGFLGGGVADVSSALFLEPAALSKRQEQAIPGVSKEVLGTISEVETQRVRRELKKGPGVGILAGPVFAYGGAKIESFKILRKQRKRKKAAKEIRKQAAKDVEIIKGRVESDFSPIGLQQSVLNQDIETFNKNIKAGEAEGFTEGQVAGHDVQRAEFKLRQAGIDKSKREFISSLSEQGIITKKVQDETGGTQFQFSSKAIGEQGDIGVAAIEQLKVIPEKKRKFRVGQKIASEVAEAATIGVISSGAGVTGTVGKVITSAGVVGKAFTGVVVGGAVIGTGLAGFTGAKQAKATGVSPTLGATLGAGETGGKLIGFTLGANPQLSPIKFKTIKVGKTQTDILAAENPFAQGGKQVFVIAAKGKGATGIKTSFGGLPKGFNIGKITTGKEIFTPSGNIETFAARVSAKNLPAGTEKVIAQQTINLASSLRGVKIKPSEFKTKDIIQKTSSFKKLSPEQQQATLKFFEKESVRLGFFKTGKVFGSSASGPQLKGKGLARQPKDIDFEFIFNKAGPKGEQLAKTLNLLPGPKVTSVKGQVNIIGKGGKLIKLADLHGPDTTAVDLTEAVKNPFGIRTQQGVKIAGLNVNRLSQEGVNKLASVGTLRKGGFGPDLAKRSKDIGDVLIISKNLAARLPKGSESQAALKSLGALKQAFVTKFGPGIIPPAQAQQLTISPGIPGPSITSAATGLGAGISFSVATPSSAISSSSSAISKAVGAATSAATSKEITKITQPSVKAPSKPFGSITKSPSAPSSPTSISPSFSSPISSGVSSVSISSVSSPSRISSSVSSPSKSSAISSVTSSLSSSVSSFSSSISSPFSSSVSSTSSIVTGVPGFGIPFFPALGGLGFKRPTKKRTAKTRVKTKFTPSLTGAVLGVQLEKTPEQLAIGGFDPLKIRGIVTGKKAKKKKKKSKKGKKKDGKKD